MKYLILFCSIFFFQLAVAEDNEFKSFTTSVFGKKSEVTYIPKSSEERSVFIFISSVCPCSKKHIPIIEQLVKQFPAFKFYGVHSNPAEDLTKATEYYTKEVKFMDVFIDKKFMIADLVAANKTPYAVIVGEKGKVLFKGGVTSTSHPVGDAKYEPYLQQALLQLQQGKSVTLSEARSIGCAFR